MRGLKGNISITAVIHSMPLRNISDIKEVIFRLLKKEKIEILGVAKSIVGYNLRGKAPLESCAT